MKKVSATLRVCVVSAALGCASNSTPTPDSAHQEAVSKTNEPAQEQSSLSKQKDPIADELASVVAGPALDDLPPPPPSHLEHDIVDLTQLKEPPRLVVDTQGHSARISELLYSHDGRSLVTASYDKTVRVWSATTGELKRTIRGELGEGPAGRIHAAALSPGDRLLAVGGWLGTDPSAARSTSSNAFQIRVFDFQSETSFRLLSGHSDTVLSLAFSHDGKRLLSGGGDG